MKPVKGLALGGRYHLVRRIAVGGMGEVWVAQDDSLGRDVAVKVLRAEFAGDEDFLRRLRTEARNNAKLSHPCIAQMYDYGEQDGTGYLVMELVQGEPMSDLLEREPVVPVARLLPILSQAADGLHAAHVAGVVHRDVKPGNILLERGGGVKLTDFGVSLAANQVPMTATGMVMGTAQYLSPEQAIGRPATPASDVYALGIVAFEALMGKRPFTGPTPVDIAVAHVNQPVPPMSGTIDRELVTLVEACLSKDPAGRPRSAAVMARALEQITARIARDRSARRGAHATEVIALPPSTTTRPASPSRGSGQRPAASAVPERAEDKPGETARAYPPRRVVQQSRAAEEKTAAPRSRPAPTRAAARTGTTRAAARPVAARHRDAPARSTAPAQAPAAAAGAGAATAAPPPPPPSSRATVRTRAEVRRDQEARAARPTASNRLGGGGIGPLSWPAVALVVAVVVLILAAVFGLAGGGGSGDGKSAGVTENGVGDGMIVLSTTDWGSAHGGPTIDKDA
ncbi:serine/threonine-protein kinase [Luteimicrobium subarcticum]|uniref:non-specific serine/threonine protein kinase n=1 Tax=Luteimicrobium subarcticum TaxID=620910 RepID=A0A2M8WJF9_9MICO|nr:serine/threonine-protein kinase [Luteimicrobium subarcticum]PJI91052.1 serine/threonine-protein kinase [Luteimicrobium subarcticum]